MKHNQGSLQRLKEENTKKRANTLESPVQLPAQSPFNSGHATKLGSKTPSKQRMGSPDGHSRPRGLTKSNAPTASMREYSQLIELEVEHYTDSVSSSMNLRIRRVTLVLVISQALTTAGAAALDPVYRTLPPLLILSLIFIALVGVYVYVRRLPLSERKDWHKGEKVTVPSLNKLRSFAHGLAAMVCAEIVVVSLLSTGQTSQALWFLLGAPMIMSYIMDHLHAKEALWWSVPVGFCNVFVLLVDIYALHRQPEYALILTRLFLEALIALFTYALHKRTQKHIDDLRAHQNCIMAQAVEIVDQAKKLKKTRDQALHASQAKSEFLSCMSHEIRTPLNGVIGMAQMLKQTPLTEEQEDFVSTINKSGQSLLTVINDILDFSKIESGKLELENRQFDPLQAVEDVLDIFAHPARKKGLELACRPMRGKKFLIHGDVTRVRQVLINLVSNAVKFTTKGGFISVSVDVDPPPELLEVYKREMSQDQQNTQASSMSTRPQVHKPISTEGVIYFAVQDSGQGIPPDKIYRLFQAFSQVDASDTRKFGGTGLGLAISKRLSQLMGGCIWVESVFQKGSTFSFCIRTNSIDRVNHAPPGISEKLLDASPPVPPGGDQTLYTAMRSYSASRGSASLNSRSQRPRRDVCKGKKILILDTNITGVALADLCTMWDMEARLVQSKSMMLQLVGYFGKPTNLEDPPLPHWDFVMVNFELMLSACDDKLEDLKALLADLQSLPNGGPGMSPDDSGKRKSLFNSGDRLKAVDNKGPLFLVTTNREWEDKELQAIAGKQGVVPQRCVVFKPLRSQVLLRLFSSSMRNSFNLAGHGSMHGSSNPAPLLESPGPEEEDSGGESDDEDKEKLQIKIHGENQDDASPKSQWSPSLNFSPPAGSRVGPQPHSHSQSHDDIQVTIKTSPVHKRPSLREQNPLSPYSSSHNLANHNSGSVVIGIDVEEDFVMLNSNSSSQGTASRPNNNGAAAVDPFKDLFHASPATQAQGGTGLSTEDPTEQRGSANDDSTDLDPLAHGSPLVPQNAQSLSAIAGEQRKKLRPRKGGVDSPTTSSPGVSVGTIQPTVANGGASEAFPQAAPKKTTKSKAAAAAKDTKPDVVALKVLVVEDNLVNQKVVKKMLQHLGYECEIANDGLEALDMTAKKDYDVVFMDVQMPNMGGLEASKRIRERENAEEAAIAISAAIEGKTLHSKRARIVALTASVMEEERKECMTSGMDDFLCKPIELPKLSAALRVVQLSKLASLREQQAQASSLMLPM